MLPGYARSEELFLVSQGTYAAMPRMLGAAPAQVRAVAIPEGIRYHIEFTESRGVIPAVRRFVTSPFNMKRAADELADAHTSLIARYRELEDARTDLERQRELLALAYELGQRIWARTRPGDGRRRRRDAERARARRRPRRPPADRDVRRLRDDQGRGRGRSRGGDVAAGHAEPRPPRGLGRQRRRHARAARADRADGRAVARQRPLRPRADRVSHRPREVGRRAHAGVDGRARSAERHRRAAARGTRRAATLLRQHLARDSDAAVADLARRRRHPSARRRAARRARAHGPRFGVGLRAQVAPLGRRAAAARGRPRGQAEAAPRADRSRVVAGPARRRVAARRRGCRARARRPHSRRAGDQHRSDRDRARRDQLGVERGEVHAGRWSRRDRADRTRRWRAARRAR